MAEGNPEALKAAVTDLTGKAACQLPVAGPIPEELYEPTADPGDFLRLHLTVVLLRYRAYRKIDIGVGACRALDRISPESSSTGERPKY